MKKQLYAVLLGAVLLSQGVVAKTITNSIGMKLTEIPAGSFYMGSCKLSAADIEANKKREFMGMAPKGATCPSGASADNDASDDETPQHKVRISKAFYMGTYEVTLGQFKQFIMGAGRDDLLTNDFMKYNRQGDNAAVSCVSWNDAKAFVKWLSRKEGKTYRLPTEAEWEYAARAGTKTKYSWGNSANSAGSYAWYDKNAYDRGQEYAHKVGQKKANAWGLYDMNGNVWEWVQDWYSDGYYRRSAGTDPQGPSSGRYRVYRGGGWGNSARGLRSAYRSSSSPGNRSFNLGFRVVRLP